MKVRDIMTEDVTCASLETPVEQVARIMKEEDCGSVPIVEDMDGRKLIGIVTDRDIALRAIGNGKDPAKEKVKNVMSKSPTTASPEMNVHEACKLMESKQVRRLPVVGEKNELRGIIAMADIALHMKESEAGEVIKFISEPGHGV